MGLKNNKLNLKKIAWQYRLMEYISYVVIFMIPLYVGKNHLYIYNSPKLLILTGLILFMLILYFLAQLKNTRFLLNITPVKVGLIFFLLILTLSSLLGIDKWNSFFGGMMSVNLIYIYLFSIFSLIIGFLIKNNKNFLINILTSSFISSILVMIIFYIRYVRSSYVLDGSTLGNSSYLGTYLMFNILFGLGLLFYFKKYWQKIIIIISILFIFISPVFINKDLLLGNIGLLETIKNPFLLLGISNAPTLALGISIFIFALFYLISSKKRLWKFIGLGLFISFLIGIYYTSIEFVNPTSNINKIYVENKSSNRLIAWDIAKINFHHNRVLGNGLNNYVYAFEKYYNPAFYKADNSLEKFYQPHNVILEYLSNTGTLGLIGYLSLLVIVFIALYKGINTDDKERNSLNKLKLILISVLFGYFIQNLFGFDTVVTFLMLFMVIGITLGVESNKWQFEFSKNNILYKIIIYLAILVSAIFFIFLVYLPWKESVAWGKMMVSNNNIDKYLAKDYKIQRISVMGGILDSVYVAEKLFIPYQSNLDKINNKNKGFYLKEINYIVKQVTDNIKLEPDYAHAYLIVGKYLNLYMIIDAKEGESIKFDGHNIDLDIWNKSYQVLEKALLLESNNPDIYFNISRTYLIRGDIKNSLIWAKSGIDIAPWNKKAYEFCYMLINLSHDSDFEKYIKNMENLWVK